MQAIKKALAALFLACITHSIILVGPARPQCYNLKRCKAPLPIETFVLKDLDGTLYVVPPESPYNCLYLLQSTYAGL